MREVEIAWAAGFLEGEGCFGWYGGKRSRGGVRTPALVITGTQKDREPLDRLAEIIPGGTLSHAADRWEWRLNGHAAVPVMEMLLPHMSKRRQDAILDALGQHYAKQREIETKRTSPTCPRGHLWSEHAGWITRGQRAGKRYCKACSRERAARQRQKELA